MPFGEYADFADCVRRNKDKSSPGAYCAVIHKKATGKWPTEKATHESEVDKERREHPSFTKKQVLQMVKDHARVKKAEHSGLAQIPTDNKKAFMKRRIAKYRSRGQFGALPVKMATHAQHGSGIGMKEYAEIEVSFLKPGTYKALDGKNAKYEWDVLEQYGNTYEGEPFWVNHDEENGEEYGEIMDVYVDDIDGEKWLCATIHIPEEKYAQALLSKIENGVIKNISNTHAFLVDPNDPERKVQSMKGQGITTVTKGMVQGARILSIRRHISQNGRISAMRNLMGKNS